MLEVMAQKDASHEAIFNAYTKARQVCTSPDERASLKENFQMFAFFFDDSPYRPLARLAERAVREATGKDFMEDVLRKASGDLSGVELMNRGSDRFAVFLPDATEPGRLRCSYFDEHGFYGHTTRDTYQELLKEAWTDGFRVETSGQLDRLACTDAFVAGNEFTTKVMRVNAGESWNSVFSDSITDNAREHDPLAPGSRPSLGQSLDV
ncbi:hypothetical protein MnBA_40560 [Marinobacterium sp. BA1]